jgi:hypothetical protein
MTIVAEQTLTPQPDVGTADTLNNHRLVLRFVMRMGAVSMAFVALFVWLAPGAGWEGDMVLFKFMVSLCAGFIGIAFWQNSLPPLPPTVEVDVAASELRLIREGVAEDKRVLERCAFSDLHLVELAGRQITLWGKGNRLLAEFTLNNANAHAALLAALRGEGKLA